MVDDAERLNSLQPDWFERGHAAATIIFNDPVWSQQHYAMDRGERTRHDYDPPVPASFVHALIERRRELVELSDRALAAGVPALPPDADPAAWAAVHHDDGDGLSRDARRLGIGFVPRELLDAYRTLRAVPLPGSADVTQSADADAMTAA